MFAKVLQDHMYIQYMYRPIMLNQRRNNQFYEDRSGKS